jgi:murein DD-endopeptidase MepM/ murein hydrolase activator NlpD
MELNRILKYFFVPAAMLLFAGATYEEILNDKNRQTEFAEKQVQINKDQLSEKSSELNVLKRQIDSIESKVNDLNTFLKGYENAVYMTPEQVLKETDAIIALSAEVDVIQESFKKKVINLYKHGKNYDLELLFSSRSPNEYLQRNQYLQHFSQNRKKELRELKSKKFLLEEKKKLLSLSTSSQRFYVEARRSEKSNLENKLKSLYIQKSTAENESNIISEKILRYESQLNNIMNFINNLKNNKEKFHGSKTGRISYESTDLNQLKGNLNQPLDAGLTCSSFGNYINNATNTSSFNNGIDFSVVKGSKVYSVAQGIVTVVGELPFYGKCVIIRHENGFRTVYAALSEVNVNAGDIVKLNQVIGKSGETLERQALHFEIWKDVTPLNPVEWLRQ